MEPQGFVTPQEFVGHKVREARKARRMTQTELGQAVKRYLDVAWKPQSVSAAERGEREFVVTEVAALALALGLEPRSLVPGVEPITYPTGLVMGPPQTSTPDPIGLSTIAASVPEDPRVRIDRLASEARRLARELAEVTTALTAAMEEER